MKFNGNADLNGNQLLNALMQNLSTDPTPPGAGHVYFNTSTNLLKWYNGSAYNAIYASATAATASTNVLRDGSANIAANVGTFASVTLTNAPSASTDGATKGYVDATAQGLQIKPTATVATTTTLPTYSYSNGSSGSGATITFSGTSTVTLDGHDVALGDLALVKNETGTNAPYNGLYVCTQAANGTVGTILTRSVDMATTGQYAGAFVPVGNAGTTNANTLWLCNPSGAVTPGTTAVPFTQMNAATSISAGTGITISGTTISVNSGYVGQTSITTLGTIGAGVWQGTAIGTGYGGTGANTAAGARSNLGAGGLYTGTITGNGSSTSFTVTHNLDNSSPVIQIRDSSGYEVICDNQATSANALAVTFATAPGSGATYTYSVLGYKRMPPAGRDDATGGCRLRDV